MSKSTLSLSDCICSCFMCNSVFLLRQSICSSSSLLDSFSADLFLSFPWGNSFFSFTAGRVFCWSLPFFRVAQFVLLFPCRTRFQPIILFLRATQFIVLFPYRTRFLPISSLPSREWIRFSLSLQDSFSADILWSLSPLNSFFSFPAGHLFCWSLLFLPMSEFIFLFHSRIRFLPISYGLYRHSIHSSLSLRDTYSVDLLSSFSWVNSFFSFPTGLVYSRTLSFDWKIWIGL